MRRAEAGTAEGRGREGLKTLKPGVNVPGGDIIKHLKTQVPPYIYVYVLSFYDRAREDERFREALYTLQSKLQNGNIVVERAVPKLARLSFCEKGRTSEPATRRYREILSRIENNT